MFAYWLDPAERPNSPRQWRASGANQEPWAEPSRLWRPLSNRRYVPRALTRLRPRGCSHRIVGEMDAAPHAKAMRASVRTDVMRLRTAGPGLCAGVRTGGLDIGARVHTHRRGRAGRRAEGDVALHRAAEFHQIGIASLRGEREHRDGGAVGRDAARDQVGEHG